MPVTPRHAGHRRTWLEQGRVAMFLVLIHAAPVVAILRGTTTADWLTFGFVYLAFALFLPTGLHRYFSHHAFRTSRAFQAVLALGTSLSFSDPIGFAGKHRIHHRYADTDDDVHTPVHGWWNCWIWSMADDGLSEDDVMRATRDLARFPELRLLHRCLLLPGVCFGAALFFIGGFPRLAIGYCLTLALVLHFSSAVNYVCHRWGTRRFATADRSRNNALVALLTWGEGWHNNHHFYPGAARAGFSSREIDLSYLFIRLLAALGLVWKVRAVPAHVFERCPVAVLRGSSPGDRSASGH
jgi:stearoyl-CoA desaturase (delta-9 desaturase)